MAKKDELTNNMSNALGGIDNFFGGDTPAPQPKTTGKKAVLPKEDPGSEKLTRYNYVVTQEQKKRLKKLAAEKDMTLKDILEAALSEYLDRHENGK